MRAGEGGEGREGVRRGDEGKGKAGEGGEGREGVRSGEEGKGRCSGLPPLHIISG